jgi:hypothetical protein
MGVNGGNGEGGKKERRKDKKGRDQEKKRREGRKFGVSGWLGSFLSVSDGWWKKEGRNLSVWPCGAFLGRSPDLLI